VLVISPNRLLRTFLFVVFFATWSIKVLEKEKERKERKKKLGA